MKIVCLGDSITAGNGEKEENWVTMLSKNAETSYINKGIRGDTSGGMLARFKYDVVEEVPGAVLIMGGGNDFIMGMDEESVRGNLMAMVHQAWFHKIYPAIGIPPFFHVASIKPEWRAFADFEQVAEKCRRQREWVYQFAKLFQADVVDFETAFEQNANGARADYLPDGIHPNEKGNRIMADWILRKK